MPDFEENAVTSWLTELRPPTADSPWPPALRPLETQGDAPGRLAALGRTLDHAAEGDLHVLARALSEPPLRDDLAATLAQMGAARIMRLLHWLAEIDLPDAHAVISALLRDDGAAGRSLRSAVHAVTRAALQQRMFSAERLTLLETVCQSALKEPA